MSNVVSDNGNPPADNGNPPADNGNPPADNGNPPADNGNPPADNGNPPADNGNPPADNGNPPADNGNPPADNGNPPAESFIDQVPEDWRKQLINAAGFEGEDLQKASNLMDRVPSIKQLAKNYIEAQRKISAGEISSGLPENPTDEQLAAYREANGIPATVDDYEIQPAQGVEFTDDDADALKPVLEAAHKHNIPSEAMNDIVNQHLQLRQAEVDRRIQQDGMDKQQTTEMLRENWGPDFEANLNIVRNVVGQLPESVRDDFMNARLANGRSLLNSPEFLVFLADKERQANPMVSVTATGQASNMTDIQTQLETIEKKMGTSEYTDDDADRYLELVRIKQAMQQKT